MPEASLRHGFVPPHWPVAAAKPNVIGLFRSISNTMIGWSKDVCDGGIAGPGARRSPSATQTWLQPYSLSTRVPSCNVSNSTACSHLCGGRGILLTEGADWIRQRRAAMPAFRADRMKAFAPFMVRAAEAPVADWANATAPLIQMCPSSRIPPTPKICFATSRRT
jgi:hypothetical protein